MKTFEYELPKSTELQGIRVEGQTNLRLGIVGVNSPDASRSRIEGDVATHLDDDGIMHLRTELLDGNWVKLEAPHRYSYNHCNIILGATLRHLTEIAVLNCADTSVKVKDMVVDALRIDRATEAENTAGTHTPPHLIDLNNVDIGSFAAHLDGGSFAASRMQVTDAFTFAGHNLNNFTLKGPVFNDELDLRVNLGAACLPNCPEATMATMSELR